jgi:hypothetical protein
LVRGGMTPLHSRGTADGLPGLHPRCVTRRAIESEALNPIDGKVVYLRAEPAGSAVWDGVFPLLAGEIAPM